MNVVDINGLSFRYKTKFIYEDFNLSINHGSWTTIAGPNGAGKTTLVKILAGLYKNYSSIKIFDKIYNKKNMHDIKREIGFVFDIPDNYFACETVEDELAFSLENLAVAPKTIKKKINEISKLLGIDDILKQNPMYLSGGQKQKVAIGCALILEPRILVLDEALCMIDINEKQKILDILKEYNKKKRVTLISFTHDLKEAKYSDRLVILNKGKIIVDGAYDKVFKEERVMRKIGLEVPFMVELSKKLMVYDLLDNIELDMDKVVSILWK